MIKRYRRTGAVIYAHTRFSSNTPVSGTSTSQHYTTIITGEPGAVVTFEVTIYSATSGLASYEVDSIPYVVTNTFTKTIGGGGSVSIDQLLNVGATSNTLSIQLTITNTTIGTIGTPAFLDTTLTL